ncbi:MAG: transcription antitermination factor NusB [Dehalococcoidia bacterium]|jgi:N utilization substance protein B|nr:transcription antitermination factor NusB [Dehalococcoidia bacterium]
MAGIRRKARIAALQTLYELDCTKHKVEETSARLRAGETLTQEALSFSEELVKGVLQHKSELDAVIEKSAPAFPLEQMPIIDRNILRLAIFEISFSDKTPIKVAINEAIELAKDFGSDSSPRLVNGILGSITAQRGVGQ